MMIELNTKLAGFYRIRHARSDGGLIAEYFVPNLLTNTFLDRVGNGQTTVPYCLVSTNNATPAVTDTTMGGTTVITSGASPIFPNSASTGGSPDYEVTYLFGYRFNAGVATGTWASIGLGPTNTDANVCSKTLIRDALGNPTTITVLAGEILDVSYELHARPYTGLVSGTVSGVSYTAQAYNISAARSATSAQVTGWTANASGILYAANGTPAHAALTASSPFTGTTGFTGGTANASPATYTNGNYYRDVTWSWGTTAVHASNQIVGIGVNLGVAGFVAVAYGFLLGTPVGKTNLQTASFTARFSWSRV